MEGVEWRSSKGEWPADLKFCQISSMQNIKAVTWTNVALSVKNIMHSAAFDISKDPIALGSKKTGWGQQDFQFQVDQRATWK